MKTKTKGSGIEREGWGDRQTDRQRGEGERKGTMGLTKMEKEAGSQARHQPLEAGKGKAMGSSQNLHKNMTVQSADFWASNFHNV